MVSRAMALVVVLAAACWSKYTVGVVPEEAGDASTKDPTTDGPVDVLRVDRPGGDGSDVSPHDEPAEPPCDGGVRCEGACVDTQGDRSHCGACGVRCGGACILGVCGEAIVDLAVGINHSCITRRDGSAYCWGRGAEGQLGNGGFMGGEVLVRVTGAINATHVTAGDGHSCMLQNPGRVFCWGNNASGQLGDGTLMHAPAPVLVGGMLDAQDVSAGLGFSCAIERSGAVRCWGDNQYGQLGTGTTTAQRQPVTSVSSINDARLVASGRNHTCALKDRVAWCWGRDDIGALGRGWRGPPSLVPVRVVDLTDLNQIGAGNAHSCALKLDGTVWCWGSNQFGELGDDGASTATPRMVAGLANIQQIAVAPGQSFSCALDGGGRAWCWGDNQYGQLGRGTIDPRGVVGRPLPVSLGTARLSILRAGGLRACGVTRDQRGVLCWGANDSGTLGVPESAVRMSAVPVRVEVPDAS